MCVAVYIYYAAATHITYFLSCMYNMQICFAENFEYTLAATAAAEV